MSNIGSYARWERDGSRHEITIARSAHGCYYVVRMDGQFYATAETIVDALDEIADITQTCGLICFNPCVA